MHGATNKLNFFKSQKHLCRTEKQSDSFTGYFK